MAITTIQDSGAAGIDGQISRTPTRWRTIVERVEGFLCYGILICGVATPIVGGIVAWIRS